MITVTHYFAQQDLVALFASDALARCRIYRFYHRVADDIHDKHVADLRRAHAADARAAAEWRCHTDYIDAAD